MQEGWSIMFTLGLPTAPNGTMLSAQLHMDLFVKNNEL
jgi:hypothetical protein